MRFIKVYEINISTFLSLVSFLVNLGQIRAGQFGASQIRADKVLNLKFGCFLSFYI